MAEVFGESILSVIKAERLDELLHSLRKLDDSHPTDRLGVGPLDTILAIFTSPSVRQYDLHPEWGASPPELHVPSEGKVKPPVIEICGASPGSGKTQLLYHVAATSICPPESTDNPSGPEGGAVIWIDTDTRFDIRRLHSFLQLQIPDSDDELNSSQRESNNTIENALRHLHVFRPQSSSALLATLQSIPSYLLSISKHYSGGRSLRVVVISNISAFLHEDRLDSDLARDASPSDVSGTSTQPLSSLFTQRYRHIVGALGNIQATFSCTIIAGNNSLSPLQSSSLGPTHRPHLPGAWTSFCAVKIFVTRKAVPKFGRSLSAEEAEWEAEARRQAVERNGFRGWVDPWGSEAWETRIREAVERKGTFEFQVDGHGLRFAEDENTA